MLYDCHWHPTMLERDEIGERIEEARRKDVTGMVGVPLDYESSEDLLEISENHVEVFPSVGIHPQNAVGSTEEDIDGVIRLSKRPEVLAMAEIGVDHHFLSKDTTERQLEVFDKLLYEAIRADLPVILHCPRAEPLVFDRVRDAGAEKVVFHWYTGPHEILRKILDVDGYYISATPAVLYSGKLQRVVEIAGLDNILVESDGPVGYRDIGPGKPSLVPEVVNKIAEIKDLDEGTVRDRTVRNAERLFGDKFSKGQVG